MIHIRLSYHTDYIEAAPLNATDLAWSDVQGSGSVHNLRNAAVLSVSLVNALDNYSAAANNSKRNLMIYLINGAQRQVWRGGGGGNNNNISPNKNLQYLENKDIVSKTWTSSHYLE